jgi:hypothetical protein
MNDGGLRATPDFHQLEPASEVERVQRKDDIRVAHQLQRVFGGRITRRTDVKRMFGRKSGTRTQLADDLGAEGFDKANPAVPVILLARDATHQNERATCACQEPRHVFERFLLGRRGRAGTEPRGIWKLEWRLQARFLQARVQTHIGRPFWGGACDLECAQERFASAAADVG